MSTAARTTTAPRTLRRTEGRGRPTLLLAIAAMLAAAGCGGDPVPPGRIVAHAGPGATQSRALYLPGDVQSLVPTLSRAEKQCRRELKRLKVRFTPVPDVVGAGQCGIRNPVRVTALSRRIALTPPATMTCEAALAAARWAHRDLAPAARRRYASNVSAVRHMSAYSCRRIRGSGRLSEHGKGNALDVGAITLGNGRTVKVKRPGFFSFREKSFLKAIRKGACKHFTTVLGPGSDRDHADHFHFDVRKRGNGRYCDL